MKERAPVEDSVCMTPSPTPTSPVCHSRASSGASSGGGAASQASSKGGMEDEIIRQSRCPSAAAPDSPDSATHQHYALPKLVEENFLPVKPHHNHSSAHYHPADVGAPRRWKWQERERPTELHRLSLTLRPPQRDPDQGFGISLKGGSERREALAVAGVVLRSPADKAGVLVGDVVLDLAGQDMAKASLSQANLLLRRGLEERLLSVTLQRAVFDTPPALPSSQGKGPALAPTQQPITSTSSSSSVSAPPDPRPPQLSCPEPRPLQTASPRLATASPSLSPCPSDYRVSAMEVRRAPGRITDFVPESERSASSEASGSLRRHSPGLYTREQDLVMDQLATEHKAGPLVDVGQSPTPPSSQALSPASPLLSGTGDEEAAYSHVKRDIVFAKEPLPWQNGGESPGRSVDESREQLGLLSLAARNPPPPPPHRDTANCADSERHNCADGRQHHPMPSFRHRDTHEHWLVQEADDRQRITEKVPEGQKASPQARPPSVDQPPAPTSPAAAGGPLLSVSGRQNCTHCGQELGRGAAMIIESLHLFYHLECFMCCVCGASLGSGSSGADVRVRRGKLHCHSCYSNDEAGLQLSQV